MNNSKNWPKRSLSAFYSQPYIAIIFDIKSNSYCPESAMHPKNRMSKDLNFEYDIAYILLKLSI